MKSEKPAEGILKRNDYGDTKTYSVPCSCGCGNGTHNVWVESDITGVTVTTYQQVTTRWWDTSRLKTIWTLLTKGYIEYEACTIMSQQQALNYADTIRSAVKDVEQFRKEKNVKD